MPLVSKSRTTLKNPITSRTAGPPIKTQVTNTRIDDDPSCDSDGHDLATTLALIQKRGLYALTPF